MKMMAAIINSSVLTCRVLRPPGGASSIFLGGDPPPTKPPESQTKPAERQPTESQTKPTAVLSGQQTKGVQEPSPRAPTAAQQYNVGKTNTAVHTSSKVLNPPGGRSNFSLGWS